MRKRFRLGAVSVTQTSLRKLSAVVQPNGKIATEIVVTGKCPRCEHDIEQHIPERVWVLDKAASGSDLTLKDPKSSETLSVNESLGSGLRQILSSRTATANDYLPVNCNCTEDHGHSSSNGCGAWWGLDAQWPSTDDGPTSAQLSAGHRPTGYDIQEEEERQSLGQTELERLRSAAGNWRSGLAALLVLIPTLVVVKANDSIKDLALEYRVGIGALIAIGMVLTIVAALSALRAAYGPLEQQNLEATEPGSIRQTETPKIVKYLIATRVLTIYAIAFLALAISEAWLAPTANPAFVKVTHVSGNVTCGVYVGGSPDAITLKTPSGSDPIPLTDVKAVDWVTAC